MRIDLAEFTSSLDHIHFCSGKYYIEKTKHHNIISTSNIEKIIVKIILEIYLYYN